MFHVKGFSILLGFILTVAVSFSAGADQTDSPKARELSIVASLGCGPSMDVALEGNHLYVIGRGQLHVADVSDPLSPRLVGRLGGLGGVRQIVVKNHVAYITSREEGLFLVDVSQPQSPVLLSHYDTIGMSTGIAVSGNLAMIACTHSGVELVDVSNPRKPVHLSKVMTGEAQSVIARDGILYVGVWAARQLVICDIRQPRQPTILATASLDGYGDGVDVRGRFCYITTGHHSKAIRKKDPSDPGYGHGHGLEIFDVSNPAKPTFVSRVKFPVFYSIGYDMWNVTVSGNYAFVTDTHNGAFVVDVSQPECPQIVVRKPLPVPANRSEASPAAGLAVGENYIYVAGGWTDVHVMQAQNLASPVVPEPDSAPVIPPASNSNLSTNQWEIYQAGGQVHAVAISGETAWIAAGMAGLQAIRLKPVMEKLAQYETESFALDVQCCGDFVYVAEGLGGLSIWKRDAADRLTPQGRYRVKNQSIKQVVVPSPGRYAVLHVGAGNLQVVDVSDPTKPINVLSDAHPGLFYSRPLAQGLLDNRYIACQWHVSGIFWYDLYPPHDGVPCYSGHQFKQMVRAEDGVAYLGDRAVMILDGGYVLIHLKETRPPNELPRYAVADVNLSGKPNIFGQTLFVSNGRKGTVVALDITRIDQPRLLGQLELTGNPGFIAMFDGQPLIPAGYQGLLKWNLFPAP